MRTTWTTRPIRCATDAATRHPFHGSGSGSQRLQSGARRFLSRGMGCALWRRSGYLKRGRFRQVEDIGKRHALALRHLRELHDGHQSRRRDLCGEPMPWPGWLLNCPRTDWPAATCECEALRRRCRQSLQRCPQMNVIRARCTWIHGDCVLMLQTVPVGTVDRSHGPNADRFAPEHHVLYGSRVAEAHDYLPKW